MKVFCPIHHPKHMSIAVLMAALLSGAMVSPAVGQKDLTRGRTVPTDYGRRDMRDLEPVLKDKRRADAIMRFLDEQDNQMVVDMTTALVAMWAHEKKDFSLIEDLVDRYLRRGDLDSTILAADFLLESTLQAPVSSYALTRDVRDFPDALCEKALAFLDHPNPVVQAQGDWMLTQRVKLQHSMTRHLQDFFVLGNIEKDWYHKWKTRGADFDLRDDYARQLISLNRHRTMEGVNEAVEVVAARMEKFLAAAGSDKASAGPAIANYENILGRVREAMGSGDLDTAHKAYLALRKAARDVIILAREDFPKEGIVYQTHGQIPGGVWNVNVPVTGPGTPLGEIYLKKGADPETSSEPLLGGKLGEGALRGLDLHWDADRILFSFWATPHDASQPLGYGRDENAHIYEMNLESREVTQLTNTPGHNDIEPCFLPDGGYVFASDRSSFGNQCAGPILQNKRCTTLYRLDPKRADVPVALSNNKDFDRHPHVLNDGTIVFMHWEYQERGLYHSHVTWRCRPDGTNMDAYYKQHISEPMSIRDVQQAPESDIHVATAQGHHDGHNGPLIIFNPSLGINNSEAMWMVSRNVSGIEGGFGPLTKQVVEEGGIENAGGSYINPFPLSEKTFLVGHDMVGTEAEFSIYYVDVWGNKELIHQDPDLSCFWPHPLRKREKPPIVADTIDPTASYATAFVEDVYRDLPGVEKGQVKYLRLSQALMLPAPVEYDEEGEPYNHLHYLPGDATTHHFGHWVWAPRRTIGIVSVTPEGQAFFKVPAGTPVYLQALDENFCEIRRMRTSFTLQRGEFRSCTGCHETRLEAVGNRESYPQELLSAGPETPAPPAWGDRTVLDFEQHIMPIFQRYCTDCHGQNDPEGGLEFTSREIGGFMQAYRTIFGLQPDDPTPVKELDWHLVLEPEAKNFQYIEEREAMAIHRQMQANEWPDQLVAISDRHDDASITQPLQFGSNKSILIRTLLDNPDHAEVRQAMSEDEWLMLVTWVDYNAYYHGTLFDVSHYQETKTFNRVPYMLPDVWEAPADLNPSFLNVADTRQSIMENAE